MSGGRQLVVAGGGAAGFFGAIAAAEALRDSGDGGRVILLEATQHLLAKVRVSGGGRCNTTNACQEPRLLIANYPRGGRELLGPFTRFGPRDTVAWYKARGVELKTEPDGRMFPITDSSATIIDCLTNAARSAGVEVRLRCGVQVVERAADGAGFQLKLTSGDTLRADALLLATGGNKSSAGLTIAQQFGHKIEPPVPSLFTFHVSDPRLAGMAGVVVERAALSVPGTKLKSEGPVLVTHEGLSGPGVLRLSAWGARELAAKEYRFTVAINFLAGQRTEAVEQRMQELRTTHGKKQLSTWCPFELPNRFWEKLLAASGARATVTWAELPGDVARALARQLTAAEFTVTGKSMNKEEFVTCGGVSLREVDFRTMESRLCPGLHFAGEVLDIDGITGGFNFQAAWTTSWHAGRAMAGVTEFGA